MLFKGVNGKRLNWQLKDCALHPCEICFGTYVQQNILPKYFDKTLIWIFICHIWCGDQKTHSVTQKPGPES